MVTVSVDLHEMEMKGDGRCFGIALGQRISLNWTDARAGWKFEPVLPGVRVFVSRDPARYK